MTAGQMENRDSGAAGGGSERSGCTTHTSSSAAILDDEADGRRVLREAGMMKEVVEFETGPNAQRGGRHSWDAAGLILIPTHCHCALY